jgi:hypothetical protein
MNFKENDTPASRKQLFSSRENILVPGKSLIFSRNLTNHSVCKK